MNSFLNIKSKLILFSFDNHNIIQQVDILCKSIGHKQLLQEVCQFLFDGFNPIYDWSSRTSLKIKLRDRLEYTFLFEDIFNEDIFNEDELFSINSNITFNTISAIKKKKMEQYLSRKILNKIIRDDTYYYLTKWLNQRINRDNAPKLLGSQDLLSMTENKLLLIILDAENIPDFRKYFYIDKTGNICLAAPTLPQVVTAPTVELDWDRDILQSKDLIVSDIPFIDDIPLSSQGSNSYFADEDIIILSYASMKSPQSIWSNRLTRDTRKDAADALILFDLGMLQHASNLQNIVLVTHDRFAESAAACFENISNRDENELKQVYDTFDYNYYSQYAYMVNQEVLLKSKSMYSSDDKRPIFKTVRKGSDCIRLLGRLSYFS